MTWWPRRRRSGLTPFQKVKRLPVSRDRKAQMYKLPSRTCMKVGERFDAQRQVRNGCERARLIFVCLLGQVHCGIDRGRRHWARDFTIGQGHFLSCRSTQQRSFLRGHAEADGRQAPIQWDPIDVTPHLKDGRTVIPDRAIESITKNYVALKGPLAVGEI